MKGLVTAALAGSLLAAVAVPAATAGAATRGVTVTVVRSGLNAPRHLTETGGALFVA